MVSKRKCKHDIQQFSAFCSAFEKIAPETFTVSLLEVKQAELEKRWMKVDETYEEYILGEENVKEEEDFQNEISLEYEEAYEMYQILKANIMDMMKAKAPEQKRSVVSQSALKLPAVEIQNFEGGYNKCPAFRDMIMAVVGNEPTGAPAHKLSNLQGLSPLLRIKWNSFLKNLPFSSQIKIPRWVNFSPTYRIQIHGFCDASEQAYCGAVYNQTESPENEIESHLLVAKTKVAPIKRTTIPKLKLCGALLVSKFIRSLVTNCPFSFELFLWKDSSIVLGWLQKPPYTFKTFVASRVAQIISIVSTNPWKYIMLRTLRKGVCIPRLKNLVRKCIRECKACTTYKHRWKSKYVTELQRRFIWRTKRDNLKKNDIVVIKEDSLPATKWLLCRVTIIRAVIKLWQPHPTEKAIKSTNKSLKNNH